MQHLLVVCVRFVGYLVQKLCRADFSVLLLGISAWKVGRLANLHGLKTPKYGKLFYDKAKTAEKQVETWRYYENVIPVLKSLLEVEVA